MVQYVSIKRKVYLGPYAKPNTPKFEEKYNVTIMVKTNVFGRTERLAEERAMAKVSRDLYTTDIVRVLRITKLKRRLKA